MEQKKKTTRKRVAKKVSTPRKTKPTPIHPHHIIRVERYSHSENETMGRLYLDGELQCFTLEDEKREDKVRGETRIDAGTYPVVLRKRITNLTTKYRNRFEWFDWHIEIKDLPRHSDVYIHIGNTDDDTAGCILVGAQANKTTLSFSVKAYKALYKKVRELLEASHTMEIQILNID